MFRNVTINISVAVQSQMIWGVKDCPRMPPHHHKCIINRNKLMASAMLKPRCSDLVRIIRYIQHETIVI